jgi:hypothetical protein
MAAMTAAKLNEPELACKALMIESAEESLPSQRPRVPAAESDGVSSSQRRVAVGGGHDGGGLDGWAGTDCAGISTRRKVVGAV